MSSLLVRFSSFAAFSASFPSLGGRDIDQVLVVRKRITFFLLSITKQDTTWLGSFKLPSELRESLMLSALRVERIDSKCDFSRK